MRNVTLSRLWAFYNDVRSPTQRRAALGDNPVPASLPGHKGRAPVWGARTGRLCVSAGPWELSVAPHFTVPTAALSLNL